jgi:uncharacterized protein with GYD domain
MGLYLVQYAYNAETWARQVEENDGDIGIARQIAEKLGGRFVDGWFTFGEYDAAVVIEVPDNVTAGALSVALSASGVSKAAKTTPLITQAEGKVMLRKAKSARTTPGKK